MPVLILPVSENLDELLEDGVVTTMTSLGKPRRVVIVAVDISLVLVIAVLRAKYSGT
jgi:hypothetical protein